MRSNKAIHVISCHAEGEVGDVIVGGVSEGWGGRASRQPGQVRKEAAVTNSVRVVPIFP